jgi:hypothetical protein
MGMSTTLMAQEARTIDTVLLEIQQWDGWKAIQKGAAKEYGVAEKEFYTILPEYQKFMALIALGYRGLGMWSQKVDLIWHAHILNTQRYEHFCRTVIGEMVHHVPCCDMQRLMTTDAKAQEPAFSCGEPDPGPSCEEPDPGPSCKEPDPNPSCTEADTTSLYVSDQHKWSTQGATSAVFSSLYTNIYRQVPPPDIWDFTSADGQTA